MARTTKMKDTFNDDIRVEVGEDGEAHILFTRQPRGSHTITQVPMLLDNEGHKQLRKALRKLSA